MAVRYHITLTAPQVAVVLRGTYRPLRLSEGGNAFDRAEAQVDEEGKEFMAGLRESTQEMKGDLSKRRSCHP